MRIRVAVPILSLSLCVMLAGLSLATAQQGPGRPHIDVSGPAARRLNIPPLANPPGGPGTAPIIPAGTTPAAPPTAPTPPAGPTPAGPTPGPAIPTPPPMSPTPPPMTPRAPVTPFETGIEYEPMSPNARVTFNLEDADLPDLVRLISSITGKRFILPGSKARAIKATVYAPTKVTTAEAYQAFLSILQLNGMSVVPAGRYLKIVESAGIEGLPVATYTAGEATPADDRFITRMHHLENVPAEDVATLLARFKSHEGNITAYAPTNTLIMTDMGSSIRRMLRIVEAIDIPRAGEQVWLEPVHYADATELATRLTEIFPVSEPGTAAAPGGAPRPPTPAPGPPGTAAAEGPSTVGSRAGEMRITKILSDERTNSLVIIATERAYLRILEMVRALDIPLEGEGRVHVHYVQHGDAEDIATALTSIVGGGGGGGAPAGPPGAPRPAGAAAAGGGGTPFEGSVRISAHKPTNSLVITSSLHDYATLRNVIGRLDVERRQVFIEAVIMELQVKRGTKAGLSLHSGIPDSPAAGALSLFGFNARGSLGFPNPADQETLTGLALGVRGPAIQQATQSIGISIPAFGVVLNALSTSGDVNVLSTPHIMAMDNVEAEISVGADIPLQTNSGFGTGAAGGLGALAGGLGAGAIPGQAAGLLGGALGGLGGLGGGFGAGAAARRKVGTKIHITPHINEANEIRLEIEEEISERQASEGTLGVVSVAERTAKTQLVVRDQQTVVIGGLMRDSVSTEETKVPILGDIPLLGILFRRTNRTVEKTNLLLFLTPYIIRSAADLRTIFERKMRERQEFIDRYFVFGDQEYTPPIDYSRTRGLVAEIINEIEAISEERRLLEEAAARPPPDHVPRRAVGAVEQQTEPQAGDVVISPESPQGRVISEDDPGGLAPPPVIPAGNAPPPSI